MLIPVSGILYPMLFKELGIILGYSRLSAWGNFYASGVGISMTIVYLFRHEYITYWHNPPYSRIKWILVIAPASLGISIAFNIILITVCNPIWAMWKHEIGGYEYFTYGIIVYFIDSLCVKTLQNFLSKPIKLDDENNLGEELSISGLGQKEISIHFHCFQDLLRASDTRKLKIMDPKISQWNLLLDIALNYMTAVPRHIQNYSTMKSKNNISYNPSGIDSSMQSFMISAVNNLYFLFNEPFEVKFRNELFRHFTIAALASNVITQFVITPGSKITHYQGSYKFKLKY